MGEKIKSLDHEILERGAALRGENFDFQKYLVRKVDGSFHRPIYPGIWVSGKTPFSCHPLCGYDETGFNCDW